MAQLAKDKHVLRRACALEHRAWNLGNSAHGGSASTKQDVTFDSVPHTSKNCPRAQEACDELAEELRQVDLKGTIDETRLRRISVYSISNDHREQAQIAREMITEELNRGRPLYHTDSSSLQRTCSLTDRRKGHRPNAGQ